MASRVNPFAIQPTPAATSPAPSTPSADKAVAQTRKRKASPDKSEGDTSDAADTGREASRLAGRRVPQFVALYQGSREVRDGYVVACEQERVRDVEEEEEEDGEPTEAEISEMSPEDREAMAAEWAEKRYQKDVAFRPFARARSTFEAFRKVVGPSIVDEKMRNAGTDAMNDWLAELDAGASDARSHDTHKMTSLVAELVNTIIPTGEAKLSEHSGAESRAERGLQNKYTGRLLTDIASNWDDPVTQKDIREGKISWVDTFFIRLLYPEDGHDVTAVRKNFTMSRYMVVAYKLIYLSPSEARAAIANGDTNAPPRKKRRLEATSGPRRKSLAAKMNMQAVCPRSIAYTACQLHFALTDAKDWTQVYDGFNYAFFYDFIVDFFEGPHKTDQRRENAEEILAWWNKQIFPSGHCRARDGQDIVSRSAALLDSQD